MSDTTSDPAEIERELDQTRSRLGTHLDQLQDRLSPGQILDDLLTYFKGSEGGAVGGALMENIRTNPMPAAITGIGLAWLMATTNRAGRNSSSGLSHYGRDDYDATMIRVRSAEQGVSRLDDDTDATYTERLNTARGQAMGLAQHAQETAESFAQRVRDAMTGAQEALTRTAQSVRDTVGEKTSAAGDALGSFGASAQGAFRSAANASSSALSQGRQASGQFTTTIAESPIALGALGLAAGALLGALLPRAPQEEALLGGAAGQLRETATNLGRQAVESGQNVARTVADKARESAGQHGLNGGTTPGQLVDSALSGDLASNAKEVLTDTMRAGREAAHRELGAKPD